MGLEAKEGKAQGPIPAPEILPHWLVLSAALITGGP